MTTNHSVQKALAKIREGVETINLSVMYVGPEGARGIVKALEENFPLRTLSWVSTSSQNMVSELGLLSCGCFRIRLNGSELTPEGAKYIAAALENNNSLQTLSQVQLFRESFSR